MSNVNKLPDAYSKLCEDGLLYSLLEKSTYSELEEKTYSDISFLKSNNDKLLEINELSVRETLDDITDVFNSLDLFQAYGKTLDLYGDMVGQLRGELNDDQYRFMILNKIGQNICQGDYYSVISLIVQMFGCTENDIIIKDSTETCKVEITKFPLAILVNAGFSSSQAVKMIELLLPACVKVSTANFNGTFEFADEDNSYDEDKGFGDIEQTIGGYLGLVLGDETDIVLPI